MRKISQKTGKELVGTYAVGWLLLRWAANPAHGEQEETEQWMALLPSKWKGDAAHSWRFNLEEESWLV